MPLGKRFLKGLLPSQIGKSRSRLDPLLAMGNSRPLVNQGKVEEGKKGDSDIAEDSRTKGH
jgi:hypothetical protein